MPIIQPATPHASRRRRDGRRLDLDVGLIAAVGSNDFEQAKRHLDRGAHPNALSERGHHALAMACSMSDLDVVKLLVDQGSNLILARPVLCLLGAACHDRADTLEYLISDLGADPNALDTDLSDSYHNHTPIARAARCSAPRALAMLIQLGAQPDAHADSSCSPLRAALDGYGGDPDLRSDLVIALLNAGADPNSMAPMGRKRPFDTSILMEAARHGAARALRALISHGARIHDVDAHGQNALHHCLSSESIECASILVELGVDPELRDAEGFDVLDRASARSYESDYFHSLKSLLNARSEALDLQCATPQAERANLARSI